MRPTVAILGRPNVGKSTLFNRLVGRKLALVDDRPGVTRDRREAEAQLGDLYFRVIDTAGFETAAEGLVARMRAQTEAAIREADAVLVLVDARAGVLPADREFVALVRRSGKPAVLVANKAESRKGFEGAYEAFALGLGDPVAVSAEHGEGLADLRDALAAILPGSRDERPELEATRAIRVAVIGRPNAGKSTLINRLLGAERLLTGPEPGITRDSIAVPLERAGQRFELFDTAGLRRRTKVDDKLEKLSAADALRAVRFAEVVVLLIDATHPFEEQDLRLADLAMQEGRALVLAISKSDLAEKKELAKKYLRTEVDHWLPQARGAPVVPVSGLTGEGLEHLLDAIVETYAVWNRRVPTAALNRFLEGALAANSPPVAGGRIKLRYMTQPKARPPSFVLFGTRTDALPESYQRYLVNGLRETFDLPGVPIRLAFREAKNPYAGKKRRTR